jgi:outer membrane protein OmpA-like peptidoglycan-associated protein
MVIDLPRGQLVIRKFVRMALPAVLVLSAVVIAFPAVEAGATGTSLLTESFNNTTTSSQDWTKPTGSAGVCLTAGTDTSATPIADCDGKVGIVSEPVDAAGSGALQLTNNAGSQVGTIYNGVAVPTVNGLDISWTSYQFNGNGADGISFDLAAVDPSNPTPPSVTGPSGGDLGYSTTGSTSGVPFGYLGFGADVYGNFENSAFGGSTCTTTPAVANSLGVRGPGNGTTGYCLLGQTTLATHLTLDDAGATSRGSGSSSIGVPEEVVLNPSGSAITASQSGISVPAGDWLFAVKPLNSDAPGTTWTSLEGTLPTNPTGVPTAWLNSTTHLPQELAFGFAASTGGENEFHQINLLQVSSLTAAPSLALTNTDSGSGVLSAGSTSTVTLTPSVASGSAASESQNVVVTDSFPASLVPTAASGTGWTCTVTSPSISCTYTTATAITAGTALPPISVTLTTSGTPGSFSDTATATSSDAAPATATDSGSIKANQTISYSSTKPSAATVGGTTYTVADSSTSALAVTTTVDAASTSVCSLSGAVVSFIGVGTCTLDANQAGNGSYFPATQVQQSFNVGGLPQSITGFSTAPSNAIVGGLTYSVSATGGGSGNAVTFTIDASSSSVCTISGAVVTFIGVGTCTIDANQLGNATYSAAPQAQQSFSVAKIPQTNIVYSTAPTAAVIDGATYTVVASGGGSGNPMIYTIDSSASSVCTISGNVVSFIGSGTCTIDVNQAGSLSYIVAPQVQQSFSVAKIPQSITGFSTAPTAASVGGATYSVSATGGASGNAVTYTIDASASSVCAISGGVVSFIGTGTCKIDANQAGNATYAAASQAQQSFGVGVTTLTITASSPTIHQGGTVAPSETPVGLLPGNTISGVTYTYAGVGGTTYGPSTTAPTAVGTYSVTPSAVAFSSGSLSSYSVTYVAGTLTISSVSSSATPLVLSFTSTPTSIMNGSPPGTYDVVAVAGPNVGTVVYSSSTTSVCTVSSSGALSILSTGTCTIDANDTGGPGYSPAAQISKSFAVTGPTQTIVFTSTSPGAPKVGGTFKPTATGGGSGNPVTFSLGATSSGCTYNAATGLVTFTAAKGNCVLDANQAGNSTYSAAAQNSMKFAVGGVAKVAIIVYFANNSWQIRSADKNRITGLAAAIKADHLTNIAITGYASSTGALAHNSVLGTQRANAAAALLKALLAKLDITQVRITCSGKGASNFVVFPATKAANRRATITAT